MQPGFPVAAATAYWVAGFRSPGCHGCTGEVVSSNLLSLLLIAVIWCWYVIVCRAASLGIKAKNGFWVRDRGGKNWCGWFEDKRELSCPTTFLLRMSSVTSDLFHSLVSISAPQRKQTVKMLLLCLSYRSSLKSHLPDLFLNNCDTFTVEHQRSTLILALCEPDAIRFWFAET